VLCGEPSQVTDEMSRDLNIESCRIALLKTALNRRKAGEETERQDT
jgi:hypothetical protein